MNDNTETLYEEGEARTTTDGADGEGMTVRPRAPCVLYCNYMDTVAR